MPKHIRPLTPKMEQFAQLYVEGRSASEAYRIAYGKHHLKGSSVWRQAHHVLKKPAVASYVDELKRIALARHEVTVDKIVQELALIAFANMLDYVTINPDGSAHIDLGKLTHAQGAAIGELAFEAGKMKFKLSDKQGALEKLGKHLGMFPTQVSGKDNGPVQITLVRGDDQL